MLWSAGSCLGPASHRHCRKPCCALCWELACPRRFRTLHGGCPSRRRTGGLFGAEAASLLILEYIQLANGVASGLLSASHRLTTRSRGNKRCKIPLYDSNIWHARSRELRPAKYLIGCMMHFLLLHVPEDGTILSFSSEGYCLGLVSGLPSHALCPPLHITGLRGNDAMERWSRYILWCHIWCCN